MEYASPNPTPPTEVPAGFHPHAQFKNARSVEDSARHLAGWSLGLGLGGLATCGAASFVAFCFGIASLMKKRTAFGWTATVVSAVCTMAPIGGCVWWTSYTSSKVQEAMRRIQFPTLQASIDLVQWHEALAAAKLTDNAPAVWTIGIVAERNPNLVLPLIDPWGSPYTLDTAGLFEFRSIGPDLTHGTSDDMVIDQEGITRTINASDETPLQDTVPYSSKTGLMPATEEELALLTEAQLDDRINLVIEELKVSTQPAPLRRELTSLAKQRAMLEQPSIEVLPKPEAHSLSGRPLFAPAIPSERENMLLANLKSARESVAREPESEEASIWVGRRLAYLGRFQESIHWYSDAINHFGSTPKLLRHRGHRYITVREFDKAIQDLSDARQLMLTREDEIEPDGIPTPAGPRSTLKGNIAYHLALANFCKGDLDAARDAWQEAIDLATNDDSRVAARYWLAITEFERGDADAARSALEPITVAMDVQENQTYLKLILLLKGTITSEAIIASEGALGIEVDQATRAFGTAMYLRHVLHQDEGARALFKTTNDLSQWASFAVIASEAVNARTP